MMPAPNASSSLRHRFALATGKVQQSAVQLHHGLQWLLLGDQSSPEARQRESAAFLPAALEIQETPPLTGARRILWVIVIFFIVTLLWACLGHVDIVVSAPGKVVPNSRVKLVQPLEAGVVTKIHVQEGQKVRAGDPLIDLDATGTAADETRVRTELAAAHSDEARLTRLRDALQDGAGMADPGALASGNSEQRLLLEQWHEYRSRRQSLRNELEKSEAQRAGIRQTIVKLEQLLPLITARVEALESLSGQGLAPKQSLLELQAQQVETAQDLEVQRHRLKEADAQVASLRNQEHSLAAEISGKVLEQKLDAERRGAALEQELVKAGQRSGYQSLKAPIDGVVKQLAIHTVGGVVTPAQELMQIVPDGDSMEIEALIENKDIGFVRAGQHAEIKVDAFPFTRYGVLAGELSKVAADATLQADGRLTYAGLVSATQLPEGEFTLVPGMTTTVEIKTGKRRIIEFFMSPVMRYKQASLREQ